MTFVDRMLATASILGIVVAVAAVNVTVAGSNYRPVLMVALFALAASDVLLVILHFRRKAKALLTIGIVLVNAYVVCDIAFRAWRAAHLT